MAPPENEGRKVSDPMLLFIGWKGLTLLAKKQAEISKIKYDFEIEKK